MKLLDFIPQTVGEQLFQLIIKEFYGAEFFIELQALKILSIGDRSDHLSEYFMGVSAFNTLARSIKKAERIRLIENESLHHPSMVEYIGNPPEKGTVLKVEFSNSSI